MFGYIRPSKPRLSEQDEARFQSVYCGLCHELGRKYGFSARFVLNFDFTFLAILLSGAQEPECESCRCAAHPCKAQCVMAHTDALETAADHSLVLAWWQIKDHIEDHGFFKAIPYRLASLLLRRAYHQASKCVPEFDASVQRHLKDLHECELRVDRPRSGAFCRIDGRHCRLRGRAFQAARDERDLLSPWPLDLSGRCRR